MFTLHEFLVFTKGWEYIVTILFVLCFVAFWEILNRRQAG